MEFVGGYIGNVASEWISSTVEGAKSAAAAYGGNLAGDAIAYGGGVIESAGRSTGNAVAGAFRGYGAWINGYGDKLKSAPASSLPKSGPLAAYKAGGTGSTTLKRSSSYGPASSSSKALTKTTSTVTKTGSGALSGANKTGTGAVTKVGKGASGTLAKAKTNTAEKKQAISAKQGTGKPTAPTKASDKPVYPGTFATRSTKGIASDTKRPTQGRSQSYPRSATNASGKVTVSPASKPQPKGHTPNNKRSASTGKDLIPMGGIAGDKKPSTKGYTPSYGTTSGAAKSGSGGPGNIDRSFF